MKWERTSTTNKITGNPNHILYMTLCHCLVFMRTRGWAYTIRGIVSGGDWLQRSSRDKYFNGLEEARIEAQLAGEDFQNRFSHHIVAMPVPFEGRFTDVDLERMGLTREQFEHAWDDYE